MNKTETQKQKNPMAYEEACLRYAEWCERETAKECVIPIDVPTPNCRLSQAEGSTWRLRNVNGPLATVGWNGRVWRSRREGN